MSIAIKIPNCEILSKKKIIKNIFGIGVDASEYDCYRAMMAGKAICLFVWGMYDYFHITDYNSYKKVKHLEHGLRQNIVTYIDELCEINNLPKSVHDVFWYIVLQTVHVITYNDWDAIRKLIFDAIEIDNDIKAGTFDKIFRKSDEDPNTKILANILHDCSYDDILNILRNFIEVD